MNANKISVYDKTIFLQFIRHLEILDSASKNAKGDTIECCHESTWFMEVNTGIESEGEKGYIGNESFTRNDIEKWHKWFDINKDSLLK